MIFSPETGFSRKKRSCLDSGSSLTRCSSTKPAAASDGCSDVTKSSLELALSVFTIFVIFAVLRLKVSIAGLPPLLCDSERRPSVPF